MTRFRKGVAAAALGAVLTTGSPSAVVIRHDKGDEEYRRLGERFAAVGTFGRAGAGTLVSSRWVVTAAHVAANLRAAATFDLGGRHYQIARVVIHPKWKEMGPSDIALVRLATAVDGVTPLEIYKGSDEAGNQIVFVGYGGTGTGLTGPRRPEDGLKRGATNTVDRVDDDWLHFTFDRPPAGTTLEGISGPGDSGGPAILERDTVAYVVGISVWGMKGENGPGTYGAREGYTRVSKHAGWILQVLNSQPPTPNAQPVGD